MEDGPDSPLFSLAVETCSPWDSSSWPRGEFVSESLDLRFESVDALCFLR